MVRFNNFMRPVNSLLILVLASIFLFGCWNRRKVAPGSLEYFRENISAEMDLSEIQETFGTKAETVKDSVLTIYKYHLIDSSQVWIGYTDKIVYACFVDENFNLMEDLVHIEQSASELAP